MPTSPVQRALLQLFVLFNVVFMVLNGLPGTAVLGKLARSLSLYGQLTGLGGAWSMFSPDPPRVNAWLVADVTMKDGTVRHWSPPSMPALDYVERYRKERYRKWAQDHVRQDKEKKHWPYAARFIAREVCTDPANPPVKVALIRVWRTIPAPDGTGANDKEKRVRFYQTDVSGGAP